MVNFIYQKKTKLLFKTIISIGLILFLVKKANPFAILESLRIVNLSLLGICFLLIIFGVIVCSYKWYLLLLVQKVAISMRRLIPFYFVGIFFNNFLPTGIGGDIVRIYNTAKYSKKGMASLTSVFMERFTGLIALVLIAMVALGFSYRMGISRDVIFIVNGLFLLCLALTVILFNKIVFNKCNLLVRKFRSGYLWNKIEKIHQTIYFYRGSKTALGKAIGVSFLFQFLSIIIGYIISLSLNLHIPLLYFFLFIPIISVITMLPVSLNGIGIREGSYIYFFTKVGATSAEAFSMSVLLYALLVFTSLIGGAIYASRGFRREDR